MKRIWMMVVLVTITAGWGNAESRLVTDMTHAARHFINSLDAEQRECLSMDMKDEARWEWHFAPRESIGLPLKDMSTEQRQLAYALLMSALSEKGAMTAFSIMSLEQILHDMQNQNPIRDPERYFFTMFGTPESGETWAWRIEGHHINLNITVHEGEVIAFTPFFLGTNPGEVLTGPRKGLRVLGEIEDHARSLVQSLNEDQLAQTLFSATAPAEILTVVKRRVIDELPEGLPYEDMTAVQQFQLLDLIKLYSSQLRPEVVEEDWKEIRDAGYNALSFSWAGGLERGGPHYFRVQGPTFLIEYDNTQQNANHAHLVWRNYEGDYGDDILLRHYEAMH